MAKDIFEYVKHEEANWKTQSVPIADGYEWNMYEHIRKTVLYLNSKYATGNNDGTRPFKNIIRRILNLQFLSTGFDVKDIEPFVDDKDHYYKSLIIRKFHPKWARENNIDTFIDETVESYCQFGLALTKHANQISPENVPLQSIAFCDQTDILSGPICIKHNYSADQLKDMEGKGWSNVDTVIQKAKQDRYDAAGKLISTPGKYIEVYEVDGNFPSTWIETDANEDFKEEVKFTRQFHLITFYTDDKGMKQGLALFQGKGDPNKYKAIKRDASLAWGRACGIGGVEELFDAQVWVNYDEIRIQGMLDAASKVIHVTNDSGFETRNDPKNMENNEVATIADGKTITQLNTQPVNINLFQNASQRWEQHAQGIGSAYDAVLGENPNSGTPFKLQEAVIQQGNNPHEYRKGKIAIYLGEIYRDWILKDIARELSNEKIFSEEMSLEEMQGIVDDVVTNLTNKFLSEKVLNRENFTEEEKEQYKEQTRAEFMNGSKHFFQVLKGELKNLPIDVDININGKQKNLSSMTDKLTNIFRQILANPQGFQEVMKIQGMSEVFNDILESSGLKQRNFVIPGQPMKMPTQMPVSMQQLQNNNQLA